MFTFLTRTVDFYLSNLWWVITLVVFLAFLLYFLISYLISKKRSEKKKAFSKEGCALALGGMDNVLSHELKGSRIIVSLKDYSLVKKDKLKEIGVSGFIQKSDSLTLVIKDNAKEAYDSLFSD